MDEELKEELSGKNSFADKVREFTSTSQGRIAAIAGASAVLFIVLFLVFLAIFSAGKKPSPESKIVNPISTGTDSTASVDSSTIKASEEVVEEDVLDTSFEVYQTRDPFKPIDGSVPAASTGNGGSGNSSNGGASTVTPQTTTATVQAQKTALSLNGVTKQDGINYADIDYGNSSYSLKAGDRVGDSPYLVQQVGDSSVILLYGDDQFTLQVGQEVFK